MSTYSLPKYYDGRPGQEVIAHGVGPHEGGSLDPITLLQGGSDEEQVWVFVCVCVCVCVAKCLYEFGAVNF